MKPLTKELIKRSVAYHAVAAKAFGSVNLAIMWSQLAYWSERTRDPDGWIHKSAKEFYDELGLSRREQDTARNLGVKLGVLEILKRGRPCVMNYRLNFEVSEEILKRFCDNDIAEKNNGKLDLKIIKKQKVEKVEDTRPMLEKLLTDPRRHIQIIGIWAKEIGIALENKDIAQSFVKRNLRASALLTGYTNGIIVKTINILKNTDYLKKFTLETVGKFIDEANRQEKSTGLNQYEDWESIIKKIR